MSRTITALWVVTVLFVTLLNKVVTGQTECRVDQAVLLLSSLTVQETVTGATLNSTGDSYATSCASSICTVKSSVTALQSMSTNGTLCTGITCSALNTTLQALKTPVLASAHVNAATFNSSYNATSFTPIRFNELIYDTDNAFDNTTGRFTCPESGYYRYSFSVSLYSFSTTFAANQTMVRVKCGLFKVGDQLGALSTFSNYPIGGTVTVNGAGLVRALSTEYLDVYCSATTVENNYPITSLYVLYGAFDINKISDY
jgi:hypothetical protein